MDHQQGQSTPSKPLNIEGPQGRQVSTLALLKGQHSQQTPANTHHRRTPNPNPDANLRAVSYWNEEISKDSRGNPIPRKQFYRSGRFQAAAGAAAFGVGNVAAAAAAAKYAHDQSRAQERQNELLRAQAPDQRAANALAGQRNDIAAQQVAAQREANEIARQWPATAPGPGPSAAPPADGNWGSAPWTTSAASPYALPPLPDLPHVSTTGAAAKVGAKAMSTASASASTGVPSASS